MNKKNNNEDQLKTEEKLKPLSAEFLLARGYCCGCGCQNCPYGIHEGKKLDPNIPQELQIFDEQINEFENDYDFHFETDHCLKNDSKE